MRVKIAVALALFAVPALAQTQTYGERTQETIPVGEGRFLIFVGAAEGDQIGYTVDMLKVEDGIPFYIPLFMEEFDTETNTVNLGYGVAFESVSYHYNKNEHQLDIRAIKHETHTRYDYRYSLDNDIFHLKLATSQPDECQSDCKPKQLYKATKNKS